MPRKYHVLTLLVIVLLIAVGCGMSTEQEADPSRPDAPPEVGSDFRADSVTFVGNTENPQFIKFFAYWCTVCKAMKPVVYELEGEYWGQIDFIYLDIDDPANNEAMNKYNFTAQPLFVLQTVEGEELERWLGYVDEADFRLAFDNLLSTASR